MGKPGGHNLWQASDGIDHDATVRLQLANRPVAVFPRLYRPEVDIGASNAKDAEMPALKNAKHERFAQFLAKGEGSEAAYAKAERRAPQPAQQWAPRGQP